MYGYYVDGVDTDTATLPHGWWNRLVDVENANTGGARGQCLEPHDCVVSKLAAGREKDYLFAAALLDARLIKADVLLERIDGTDVSAALRQRMQNWLAPWR